VLTNVRIVVDISLASWIKCHGVAKSSQIVRIRGHRVFPIIEENISIFQIHDQTGMYDMTCMRGRSIADQSVHGTYIINKKPSKMNFWCT